MPFAQALLLSSEGVDVFIVMWWLISPLITAFLWALMLRMIGHINPD